MRLGLISSHSNSARLNNFVSIKLFLIGLCWRTVNIWIGLSGAHVPGGGCETPDHVGWHGQDRKTDLLGPVSQLGRGI